MIKMGIELESIGKVYSSRSDLKDDFWDKEQVYIELTEKFSEAALYGLQDFSHVEIIFYMDQVQPEKIEIEARRPRNNPDWPEVGIFSQRGKNRPNQLGLSVCEILKIENKKLFLKGLDAVDGTAVVDIKPWVKEFSPRGVTKQPRWITELMKTYWN